MPGDEVIVPAFTYVAAAEVIALLGLIPVWVDVEESTFNINPYQIEAAISPKTRAIIVVHLFGQSCDMETIHQIGWETEKDRDYRTYRNHLFLPVQTLGVLWRWRGYHNIRRWISRTYPHDS